MQQAIEDVINAGIALFRAGESGVNSAVEKVKGSFEELKKKGADDKSEAAKKLRSSLEDISSRAEQLAGKAGSAYKDGLKQLEGRYTNALDQIKELIPSDKLNQVKGKIDELRKAIKERVSK